jgi:hypothetical protein
VTDHTSLLATDHKLVHRHQIRLPVAGKHDICMEAMRTLRRRHGRHFSARHTLRPTIFVYRALALCAMSEH